ncbi:hypothetical protein [Palaeococcus ferrophilus]|uniref:hypothetical protein n=1 Tax=Palaeococcus ferrophilus TaxID=83868 RepID=UPI00064E1A3A|nr:hypothetical protein [Palaeococcus ferrophilus]
MYNFEIPDPTSVGVLGIVLAFVMILALFIFKMKKERLDITDLLRVSSIVLVSSIALIARDSLIYFLAIVIIATGITRLDFLLNLVAILRGGEAARTFFEVLVKLPYATPQEVQEKERSELEEIPEVSKNKDKASPGVKLKFNQKDKIPPYIIEEFAIRELERKYNSIAKRQVRIERHVADAVMPLDEKTDAIIEIKLSPLPLEVVRSQIFRLDAARKAYERRYRRDAVILLGIVGATPEYINKLKHLIELEFPKTPIKIEAINLDLAQLIRD